MAVGWFAANSAGCKFIASGIGVPPSIDVTNCHHPGGGDSKHVLSASAIIIPYVTSSSRLEGLSS